MTQVEHVRTLGLEVRQQTKFKAPSTKFKTMIAEKRILALVKLC